MRRYSPNHNRLWHHLTRCAVWRTFALRCLQEGDMEMVRVGIREYRNALTCVHLLRAHGGGVDV